LPLPQALSRPTIPALRPSGSTILDQAGLDTIRRAQPLPAIPEAMPEELELAIPIEFFLRR